MAGTDPRRIEFYEGLVITTTNRYYRIVREEWEDMAQMLRFKAWRAIETYDPDRATQPIEGYVFSCVRNQVKDLLKRKRRDEIGIDQIVGDPDVAGRVGQGKLPRDKFEHRYLAEEEEAAFASILCELPLIPSTLSHNERRVLVCMYLEYGQREMADSLELSGRAVARAVKGIKEKMADWRPSTVTVMPSLTRQAAAEAPVDLAA